MTWRRRLLIFPPLIVGVVVFVILVRTRPGPEERPRDEMARVVRVVEAARQPVTPRVVGHGTVEPARSWRAVAEVSGRVTTMHESLRAGAILPSGAELIRIDEADYLLAVARLTSEETSLSAQIEKLDAGEANSRKALELESRSLALAEAELGRLRKLLEQKSITESVVDTQERQVLQQRASVLAIENALRLVEPERAVLKAELAARGSLLAAARRDIGRCVVIAPFACRVSAVDVEVTQHVQPGQTMVELDGIEAAEITVRLPFQRVAPLLEHAGDIDVAAAAEDGSLWRRFGITATVRLRAGSIEARWEGIFARVSELVDQRTRSVGVIVRVEHPYAGARPGLRPPLLRGMFVEVELRGREIDGLVVIPREALHGSRVHVVNPEGRLEVREVRVAFVQFDEACLVGGLEHGERVVLTDLEPVIPGMKLTVAETVEDPAE